MKRKLLLIAIMVIFLACTLALSISAASTNEFGEVETSTKIDLTGMATDTDVRVVLFDGTEYHTYPSQYIVTSATDITLNFDKINEAFGKSYALDSVIRLEVPRHVLVIVGGVFNYGKNNNLVEVFFPADSKLTKLNWGCFESNTGLQKINLPASLTELHGQNNFAKCSSLKEVTFDEGYSVSYIPLNFFQSCSSLEKIVFPNCVTEVRGGAFGSCSKLKTIVFGDNLQTMGGPMSDCSTSGSTWYLPNSFYSSSVTSEPPSNMFHWAGTQTNGVSGTGNNPKNITFVYTGTKAEAEALQARFKAADAATGEGCVGLSRIYDATLCTEAEYEALTGKKVGEGATGYYIVYGYNKCKAFYNDIHPEKLAEGEVDTNLCVLTECARCGITNEYVGDDSTHEMNVVYAYASYFANGTITESCQNEGCIYHGEGNAKVDNDTLKPLFYALQYSTKEDGEVFGIYVEYKINQENIAKYEELSSKAVEYGVVAIAKKNLSGNGPLNVDGSTEATNVIATDVTSKSLSTVKLIVTGNWSANATAEIYMLGYVTDGVELQYMGIETVTADDVTTKVVTTSTSVTTLNAVVYGNLPVEE